MAKVNVYLPDDLEREVRDAELSVSAICQAALRDALDRVAGARAGDAQRGGFTPRLAAVLDDAKARAAADGVQVGALELLGSIMFHGENMGARVLTTLGVDLPEARPARASKRAGELSAEARNVLAAAGKVALEMRHGYIGTEHVVIAIAEQSQQMRGLFAALGIDAAALRRQVERLLANPWSTERVTSEVSTDLLARLDGEVQRLAAEIDRLRS